MAAMITIACGRPSSSRRTQQRSTSLSAYMPKGFSTQSGVSQRRTTVAKKVQPKVFRSNYKVPVVEQMKPTGRWTSKLQVKDATMVAHTTRFQPRVQVRVQVKPQVKRNSRPCAYCKEEGCHIRTCDKLAAKNARKNASKKAAKKAWKDAAAERLAAKIRKAEEEKARQEELARQQEAEDSDSSDGDFFSSSEEEEEEVEDFPALPTVAKVTKKVSFKDDSENLMKPPCDTKVFNTEDPPSSISDDEEDKEEIVLTRSANAWKPKRLREEPKVVTPKTDQKQVWHDKLLAIWRKEYEASTNSWADTADLADDLATINALRLELGLPQLDEDGEEIVEEEITTDQFGRPSADNSAW